MKTRISRIWTGTGPLLFATPARSSAAPPLPPLLRAFFTATRPCARSRIPNTTLERSVLLYFRHQRAALARRFRSARFKSDKPNPQHHDPTPHLGSPEPAPSLSQRLKQLSREYGWTAVGVYFGLSLLDFPFCFLAVRLLGTERIGHYEDIVKDAFWTLVRLAFPEAGTKSTETTTASELAEAAASEGNLGADGLTMRAESGANATIWTQLGLAYLVHKSLIFLRVPLTAAVLPKVVKTLRKWGYNIGKKKPKTA